MTKSYLLVSVLLCALLFISNAQDGSPYNQEDDNNIIVEPINPNNPYNQEEEAVIPPYLNEEEETTPPYVNEETVVVTYPVEETVVVTYPVEEEEAVIPPYTNEEEAVIPPYVNEETVVIVPIYNTEETIVLPYTNEEVVVIPPYTNEEDTVTEPVPPYDEENTIPPYVPEEGPLPPYVNEEEELHNSSPPLDGAQCVKASGDKYACPKGYHYLSYEDANNYNSDTCAAYKSSSTYRLLGGGSASGSDKGCETQEDNPKLFLKAVCVKSEIEKIVGCNENKCPEGTARATLEEVEEYRSLFCSALGQWDVARVAFMGSMDGSGYNCGSRDYDARDLGPSLCVKRRITDIQLLDSCENVCGQGLTLLTLQEALDSQEYYCSLLPADGTARLAGGGSMDGSANGCKIRDTDRRRLKDALCANKRS